LAQNGFHFQEDTGRIFKNTVSGSHYTTRLRQSTSEKNFTSGAGA
jgi:hypothetical protein